MLNGREYNYFYNNEGGGGGGGGEDDHRSSSAQSLPKTYDLQALQPRKDVIDIDAAMREFFDGTAVEWIPMFQHLTQTDTPPRRHLSSLTDNNYYYYDDDNRDPPTVFQFDTYTSPWKRLPGIPTKESHRSILAHFLDEVQASLVAIPVDESTKEDSNDLHFLEEGRRMLVCERFHVVEYNNDDDDDDPSSSFSASNRLDHFETLFGTCWNEVYQLYSSGKMNTGSVILVPGYDGNLDDLRRFIDLHLQRPLQWMGLDHRFEVSSLQRGSLAIRLIYMLSDMPSTTTTNDSSDPSER